MKIRRLLHLTARQMTAYLWHAGQAVADARFVADESGRRQLAAYLAGHVDDAFALLVDLADEGFQLETIPGLYGRDRQTVIERRLGQSFFGAPLTLAQPLARKKNVRKEERLLLAALTNREFLQPWLDALIHAGTILAGIYSVPFLADVLLARLKLPASPCVLLSLQEEGIRQSYLDDGKLLFSRLTPLHGNDDDAIARAFAAETRRLRLYLISQELLGEDQPMRAYVLAHSGMQAAIGAHCIGDATVEFFMLDLADCVRRVGLKPASAATNSTALFLGLLAVSPPRVQFAGNELRHGYRLRQVRTGLFALGGAVLAACLLMSVSLFYQARGLREETADLHNQALQLRQRYADIVKTLPPTPADSDTLRRVVDRYLALDRQNRLPIDLYREISRALQTVPAVELEAIDWHMADDSARSPATSSAAMPANPANPGNAASPMGVPNGESAVVQGVLRPGAGASARRLLEIFDRFVEALQANPKLRVDIRKRPFDIEPGKTLKHEDTLTDDGKPRSFSVQITQERQEDGR